MPVHRALLTSTKCTMRSEKQYMHLSLLDPPLPKKTPKKPKSKDHNKRICKNSAAYLTMLLSFKKQYED